MTATIHLWLFYISLSSSFTFDSSRAYPKSSPSERQEQIPLYRSASHSEETAVVYSKALRRVLRRDSLRENLHTKIALSLRVPVALRRSTRALPSIEDVCLSIRVYTGDRSPLHRRHIETPHTSKRRQEAKK